MSKILGTRNGGKINIYSKKQMTFLHNKKIDHIHFKYSGGRVIKKIRYKFKNRR